MLDQQQLQLQGGGGVQNQQRLLGDGPATSPYNQPQQLRSGSGGWSSVPPPPPPAKNAPHGGDAAVVVNLHVTPALGSSGSSPRRGLGASGCGAVDPAVITLTEGIQRMARSLNLVADVPSSPGSRAK